MFIQKAFAQFTTTTANTIVSDVISDIGSILVAGLPLLLGLVAVLVGLFFVVRLIMKKIGGSK